VRLRLIEGGDGQAPAQPTGVKPEQFNEEATMITSAPFDPDLDDELDAETVLVPSDAAPLEIPPDAVPELMVPPRRSSASIAYSPYTSATYPPPAYPPPAYPPPVYPPQPDPYRASSDSIPPYRASSGSIPPYRVSAESMPQYAPYPYPPPQQVVQIAAPPARGKLALALAIGGVLVAGGLTLGWALFRKGDAPPPVEAVTTPSTPAPTPPAPTLPVPATPVPAPPVPAPVEVKAAEPAPAKITSLVHPTLAEVTSPVGGRVASVAVAKSRAVKAGEVLITVRGGAKRNANTIALERKVTELEGLAKQDPASYAPFLASARRKLAIAQRAEPVTITASQAGMFQSKVAVGDKVAEGAPVGAMVDLQAWQAIATVRGVTPLASWSCVVATTDARHSAACEIVTTEAVEGGTRVTVALPAGSTSWLADPKLEAQILVAPR
jgi:biotin carboxyl carrier protein